MNDILTEREYLSHYGILGMKWGIRRYQNKDGTLTAKGKARLREASENRLSRSFEEERYVKNFKIKKGETFDRVGDISEKDTHRRTYVSQTPNDKIEYLTTLGQYGLDEQDPNKPSISTMTLKAIKDINVAGAEAHVNAIVDAIGDLPMDRLKTPKEYWWGKNKELPESKRRRKEEQKEIETSLNKADMTFIEDMFNKRVYKDNELMDQYISSLQNKGFQAVVDFNDKGFADLPLIVFDRAETLKTTSNVPLTYEMLEKIIWDHKEGK